MPTLNPFRYGQPVPPERFVGRRKAVRTLFSRIHNGESTAVVGEPHIGKSSVLRYIVDEKVRSAYLQEAAPHHAFIEIDSHLLPGDCKPAHFWEQILPEIGAAFPDPQVAAQIAAVQKGGFTSFALEGLFRLLAKKGEKVVVLIDEFDALLSHPGLNTAEFFGALRSLSSRTGGLLLVTASRLSVAQMNTRSQELNPLGSPFFNTFTETPLLPLEHDEIDGLLDLYLEGTEVVFSPEDRTYIRRLSGRHPYLLQVAAGALFDALDDPLEQRYPVAATSLRERAAAFFDDLWRHLPPKAQTSLLILSLGELRGHVDGRDFDTGDLAKMDWYGPELRRLFDLGLVDKDGERGFHGDLGNMVVWRGERYRVSAGSFVYWVADNAIAGSRSALDFDAWLRDHEFHGLLTSGESKKIKDLAGKIPGSVTEGIAGVLASLVKRWVGVG